MFISVIIPVKNGGADFRRCLESLQRSTHPDWECIVVDDHSTDGSDTVALSHGATVIHNRGEIGGPARCRNLGAQRAHGEILFFVDADVLVYPDTLTHVAQIMGADEAPAACFGSYDDRPTAPNFLSQYRNLLHHYVHQNSKREARTFWSGCGAIRKSVFMALGGFNTAYVRPSVEDIELGYRLHANGHPIYLEKSLEVTHMKHWSPRRLVITDIRDRAYPWACLVLVVGQLQNDLNLAMTQRLSTLLLLFAVWAALASFFLPAALLLTVLALFGVLTLNYDFYAFLRARRGLTFVVRALPWHWLYFLYSGMTFGVCYILYRLLGLTSPVQVANFLPALPVRSTTRLSAE